MEKDLIINKEIKFNSILVIDINGESLGVMNTRDALNLARSKQKDLVCMQPNAKVPVCKILDYGKYKYEQTKKIKEAKKNQKNVEVSEIQMTYTIAEHDMEIKAKTAKRLIEEKGNDVRIVMRLRGREITLLDLAKEKINHFVELCSEFATVKKSLFQEGRDLKIILQKRK